MDEEGILQARYVGRMLANLDVQVDQIISSPLKRARQTASLVANELAFEAAVQIDDALRPEAEFEQFQAMLARYKKYDAVMVVGHNPSFTEFLSKSVSTASGAAQIDFKKGAVARVEMNGRAGTTALAGDPQDCANTSDQLEDPVHDQRLRGSKRALFLRPTIPGQRRVRPAFTASVTSPPRVTTRSDSTAESLP